jgi:hypothetical protein
MLKKTFVAFILTSVSFSFAASYGELKFHDEVCPFSETELCPIPNHEGYDFAGATSSGTPDVLTGVHWPYSEKGSIVTCNSCRWAVPVQFLSRVENAKKEYMDSLPDSGLLGDKMLNTARALQFSDEDLALVYRIIYWIGIPTAIDRSEVLSREVELLKKIKLTEQYPDLILAMHLYSNGENEAGDSITQPIIADKTIDEWRRVKAEQVVYFAKKNKIGYREMGWATFPEFNSYLYEQGYTSVEILETEFYTEVEKYKKDPSVESRDQRDIQLMAMVDKMSPNRKPIFANVLSNLPNASNTLKKFVEKQMIRVETRPKSDYRLAFGLQYMVNEAFGPWISFKKEANTFNWRLNAGMNFDFNNDETYEGSVSASIGKTFAEYEGDSWNLHCSAWGNVGWDGIKLGRDSLSHMTFVWPGLEAQYQKNLTLDYRLKVNDEISLLYNFDALRIKNVASVELAKLAKKMGPEEENETTENGISFAFSTQWVENETILRLGLNYCLYW